jgi:hypothetical protein
MHQVNYGRRPERWRTMVDQAMQAIWPSWSWAVRPTIGLGACREVLERMRRNRESYRWQRMAAGWRS